VGREVTQYFTYLRRSVNMTLLCTCISPEREEVIVSSVCSCHRDSHVIGFRATVNKVAHLRRANQNPVNSCMHVEWHLVQWIFDQESTG